MGVDVSVGVRVGVGVCVKVRVGVGVITECGLEPAFVHSSSNIATHAASIRIPPSIALQAIPHLPLDGLGLKPGSKGSEESAVTALLATIESLFF